MNAVKTKFSFIVNGGLLHDEIDDDGVFRKKRKINQLYCEGEGLGYSVSFHLTCLDALIEANCHSIEVNTFGKVYLTTIENLMQSGIEYLDNNHEPQIRLHLKQWSYEDLFGGLV